MGISSEITISLESKNSQAYNLVLYDLYGNQIGIATDDGHGNKQLRYLIGTALHQIM